MRAHILWTPTWLGLAECSFQSSVPLAFLRDGVVQKQTQNLHHAQILPSCHHSAGTNSSLQKERDSRADCTTSGTTQARRER